MLLFVISLCQIFKQSKNIKNMKNLFLELLDVEKCKQLIKKTNEGEIAILLGHYSINIASVYNNTPTPDYLIEKGCDLSEQMQWDWDEFEQKLGYQMEVSDYDDLIVNKHSDQD